MVKSLRESVIKDILDAMEEIKDISGNSGLIRPRSNTSLNVSSISRASKDLVMSFPVLCDSSIDPRTASMICKAIERKAVTMLQLLFASCQFNGESGREILKQWHNNIDNGDLSLDDYLGILDGLSESCDSVKDRKMLNEAVSLIRTEMRNGTTSYPISSFSETSVNDYKVNTHFGHTMVTEDVYDNLRNHPDRDFVLRMTDSKYANHDRIRNYNLRRDTELRQSTDSDTTFLTRQLLDNDVKKCNELVPSLMIVKFNSKVGDGTVVTNQFVAGVKARLIPVDSYDIIERINSKNKDRAGLLNFIRATTKEISFVKDYLLAIDKAKIDAKNNSIRNRSGRIWKTLEKRSTRSVFKRLTGRGNDAACITTLVISQQVANTLKKEYNVNIADVKTASSIMDAYNLLCVVIVDESTEVARFLFDGDSYYEDLSFNSLERESGDGSYKKVINLLSKMNRG